MLSPKRWGVRPRGRQICIKNRHATNLFRPYHTFAQIILLVVFVTSAQDFEADRTTLVCPLSIFASDLSEHIVLSFLVMTIKNNVSLFESNEKTEHVSYCAISDKNTQA